jgi:uncharacterized protein YukE
MFQEQIVQLYEAMTEMNRATQRMLGAQVSQVTVAAQKLEAARAALDGVVQSLIDCEWERLSTLELVSAK